MKSPSCQKCGGKELFSSGLCGPCFAAANHAHWATCAECVHTGLTALKDEGGHFWHDDCATFALSVLERTNGACRHCRAGRPGADAIVDYRDRKWCHGCAGRALAQLHVARLGLGRFRTKRRGE